MAHRLTTCTFCGVGCGIYLETQGNRITGAYPSMSHPTNEGRICVRGWNVHEVASSPDRLRRPLVRRHGELQEVTWEETFGYLAERLQALRRAHGPDALAFLNVPRCSNEESYLLQKLARAVIGTNNVDHGTGVYTHNSIEVLLEMLGTPATTNSVGELDRSEAIIVDGVDLGMQLPTVAGRVIRARQRGARLIVIDARRHRVAEQADWFLQLRPGTEVLLYGAMAKVIVDRGLANLRFLKVQVQGLDAFLSAVGSYDLLSVAAQCGVAADAIETAALAYAQARSAAILYSTGAEARTVDSIRGLVNLALLTGNIGREGGGVYALTEHNNLQGVCDMGMLPDRLPGYVPVTDARARRRFEDCWQAPLPERPGLDARRVCHQGKGNGPSVRAAWLCRYDPVLTATFCDAASRLRQLDLVVVQHLFLTDTARLADVVLPLVAFGEERVTFTSTDRRIQLADQAIEPPDGPLPAWKQLTLMAQALGARWDYRSSADVMDEIAQVVPAYSGAHHENLAREYGRPWPCTKDRPLGTRFLFSDTPAAPRFRLIPIARPPLDAPLDGDYPLALVFGSSHYYWHQNILVKHSETLRREYRILLLDYPEGFVEINPADASRLQVRDGRRIRVASPQGSAVTVARVTNEVREGTVFVPFFVREVARELLGPLADGAGSVDRPACVRIEPA
jgi:predicted molibdopterin-dependent oxidoreductase YjgC